MAAASASLANEAITELQSRLRGSVLRPSDPEYDDARSIWNGMVDRRPTLIVRCEGAADVIATLGFARKYAIEFTVRAGGHNVAGRALCDGIVTAFEFKLHEVGPNVMVAQMFYRHEDAAAALRTYRDFMTDAPDEVSCFGLFVQVPPVAPFPEDQHGRPSIALVACYAGDLDDGRKALESLASFGDPMLRVLDPMPYAVLQSAFAAGSPDGARYYFKSQFMNELTDEAIDTITEWIASLPGELTQGGFEPMGGAINRVDPEATPWPHRDAAFNFSIFAGWTDAEQDDEHIAWARRFHRALEPYASNRVYVNYLDRDEKDRVSEAFGPNLERLLEVKRRYDPENVFHENQALTAVLDAQ